MTQKLGLFASQWKVRHFASQTIFGVNTIKYIYIYVYTLFRCLCSKHEICHCFTCFSSVLWNSDFLNFLADTEHEDEVLQQLKKVL